MFVHYDQWWLCHSMGEEEARFQMIFYNGEYILVVWITYSIQFHSVRLVYAVDLEAGSLL